MTICLAHDFVVGNLGCTPLGIPSGVTQASRARATELGRDLALLTLAGLSPGGGFSGTALMELSSRDLHPSRGWPGVPVGS